MNRRPLRPRTAHAQVQAGGLEVSTLLRTSQAVTLTAPKRVGPRVVAPILLPKLDSPASRQQGTVITAADAAEDGLADAVRRPDLGPDRRGAGEARRKVTIRRAAVRFCRPAAAGRADARSGPPDPGCRRQCSSRDPVLGSCARCGWLHYRPGRGSWSLVRLPSRSCSLGPQ